MSIPHLQIKSDYVKYVAPAIESQLIYARQLLRKQGGFHPFGGFVKDGKVYITELEIVDNITSKEVLEQLKTDFRERIKNGEIELAFITTDNPITNVNMNNKKMDGLVIAFDDGQLPCSVIVLYEIKPVLFFKRIKFHDIIGIESKSF